MVSGGLHTLGQHSLIYFYGRPNKKNKCDFTTWCNMTPSHKSNQWRLDYDNGTLVPEYVLY